MNLNQQGNEHFSLKRAASYLGLRYDSAKQTIDLSERLLEDISENFMDYVWSPEDNVSHKYEHSASTTEKANRRLENKLKLPFKATYNDISLGATYTSKTEGKLIKSKGTIVYTVFRIDCRKCTYRKIPSLVAFSTNDNKMRGEYVKSVWMNTWYKINFHIKFNGRDQTDDSHSSINIGGGYQDSVKLEFEKKTLEEKLKNKKIQQITVELEGLSDFQLSVPPAPLSTLDEINQTCSLIEKDYLKKLNTIASRSFVVDQDCIGLTSILPRPKIPSLIDIKLDPKITSKPGSPNFIELSKKIFSSITPAYKATLEATLGDIKLYEMLASIENVFEHSFQKSNLKPGQSSIVFGFTGEGKSTFIGYKNGSKLSLEYDEKRNLAYHYPVDDPHTCPPMGSANQSSKTKGYAIFQNIIDTAGFCDSRGKAEELCNKIAIDFAIESFQPGRVIVILDPTKLSHNKGIQFYQLMEKLKQFLWNPSDQESFSSILFVVNEMIKKPKNELDSIEDFKRDIQNKIEQLETEIQGDIKQYTGWGDQLKSLAVSAGNTIGFGKLMANNLFGEGWVKNKTNEIKDFDVDLAVKISEKVEIQDLLRQLKTSGNIVVADFRKNKTRQEVEQWEKTAPKLPISAFKLSRTLDNTRRPFFEALKLIINYFNEQFKNAQKLDDDILNLKNNIQQTKDMIALIPDGQIPTQADIDNYKVAKKSEEGKKAHHEGLIIVAKSKIKNLEKEKSDLETNVSKTFLQELTPSEPITPRSSLAYFDWTAKKYSFTYNGISLLKVKHKEPTEDEDYPGVFLNQQKPQPLPLKGSDIIGKCTFSATYRPGYHNLKEDQKAVVKLYVEKKHHPDTIRRISAIETIDLPNEKKNLQNAKKEIKKHEGAISVWEIKIQNDTDVLQKQQLKDSYLKNLNDYQKDLSDTCKEATLVKTELATYHKYCQILREILVNFQTQQLIDSKDKNLADEFIANFTES